MDSFYTHHIKRSYLLYMHVVQKLRDIVLNKLVLQESLLSPPLDPGPDVLLAYRIEAGDGFTVLTEFPRIVQRYCACCKLVGTGYWDARGCSEVAEHLYQTDRRLYDVLATQILGNAGLRLTVVDASSL